MATTSLEVVIPKKAKAKDQFINNIASSATPPAIVTNTQDRDAAYMNKLKDIETKALTLKDIIDKRVEEERMAGQTKSGPSNSLREMSSAPSPRPETPDFYGGARSAMDEYVKSLMPTDEENALAKRVSNLRSSVSSGVQQAAEQAIPMGFITGQQQAIENRGINAIRPFEDELTRLGGNREALSTGLKARQEFETALAKTKAEDYRTEDEIARDERRYAYEVAQAENEPFEFNGALYRRNPDGGFTELMSAPADTPEPFELSEGQSRYVFNPDTGQYEEVASKGKTYKPDGGGSTSDRTTQVLDGFISLNDLTLAERQKVQDELYSLGFGSEEVPQWFADEYKPGVSALPYSPTSIQALTSGVPKNMNEAWKQYRKKVMNQATSKSTQSSGIEDIGFDSIPG